MVRIVSGIGALGVLPLTGAAEGLRVHVEALGTIVFHLIVLVRFSHRLGLLVDEPVPDLGRLLLEPAEYVS